MSWSPVLVFEVGWMHNPVDHETFSVACHLGLHVGFSSFRLSLSFRPSIDLQCILPLMHDMKTLVLA